MRIIAGSAKGRKLIAPRGRDIRPTLDRVREALFNILGQNLAGKKFLDLFAGSGVVGIEALSRGAEVAVLVEKDREACRVIQKNLELCGFSDRARVICRDVIRALPSLRGEKFNVVFADPPYYQGWEEKIFPLLARYRLVPPGGVVVVESGKKTVLPAELAGFSLKRREIYGDTSLNFFVWEETGEKIADSSLSREL